MITQWAYWDNDNCFLIGRYYSANRWLTQSMWNFCNSRKLWSAMQKRVRGKFTFVEEWPNNVARLLIALLMRSVSFCWHTSVLCCSAMVSLPYSKLTVVSHSGLLSSSQRGHVDGVCKTTHKLIYFNCEPIQTYKHTYIHTTIQTNKPTNLQAQPQSETFMIMPHAEVLKVQGQQILVVSGYIPTHRMHLVRIWDKLDREAWPKPCPMGFLKGLWSRPLP